MKELKEMTLEELRAEEKQARDRIDEIERTAREAHWRWQEVFEEIRRRTECKVKVVRNQ